MRSLRGEPPPVETRPAEARTDGTRGERGSVTAEFALILPAAVLLVVALIAAVGMSSAQLGLQEAAAAGARAAARSGDAEAAAPAVVQVAAGAEAAVRVDGDAVCVTATRQSSVPVLGAFPLRAESCALRWGK